MHVFDLIASIIFISGLFIFINTFFLKLPSSLGLMILTIVLSFLLGLCNVLFPSWNIIGEIRGFDFNQVLNQFVISFILFAGGLSMDINKLGKQKAAIIIVSVVGAIISTMVIGTILYLLLNAIGIEINYMYSLIFGAVISSTDPISATNTTKRFALPKILLVKVEGESLFNGAFSVVLAFVLYHLEIIAESEAITFFAVTEILVLELIGGVAIGFALGFLGHYLLRFINNDDVHIEVLITVALVLVGSFISGYFSIYSKTVSLVMGLLIGNLGRNKTGEGSVGKYVYKFWYLVEQIMAVMLFVLMGLEMLAIEWKLGYFVAGFFAVNVVFLGRWLGVLIPVKILSASYEFNVNTVPVMTWSAFRGGLPIVLILALATFPGKDLLITMTYVVVVCSMLFQGFTLPALMRERFPEIKSA
ncbi:cation:proton antiporter [Marinoscillum pacificum]|uniref:cation:proton antiporter n=1 Tax=Marinoscillum pacificum TaxID=392723 RepID=UPI0021576D8C|nr:cation:proton antiporter [Marinoscillum pacificum]